MGSVILYISICTAMANCHWAYSGTYHPSDDIVVENDPATGRRIKRQEATAVVMCERAVIELRLRPGEWRCQPAGRQP